MDTTMDSSRHIAGDSPASGRPSAAGFSATPETTTHNGRCQTPPRSGRALAARASGGLRPRAPSTMRERYARATLARDAPCRFRGRPPRLLVDDVQQAEPRT
jgi:hypothetical protein